MRFALATSRTRMFENFAIWRRRRARQGSEVYRLARGTSIASCCINRKADGGLELPGKVVQERLGHSSIVMTMDVYGHLFKGGDNSAEAPMRKARQVRGGDRSGIR
jgi:integrase